MIIKRFFFLLFVFVFLCLFMSRDFKDDRKIDGVDSYISDNYSSELVVFNKNLKMNSLVLGYYTNNSGSDIYINNGSIYMIWNGKKAEVLGGEYIGQYQPYYGFYFGFDSLKNILDYNVLHVRLKGNLQHSHVLSVNVCAKDVKEFSSDDIKNEYVNFDIDINLKTEDYINVDSLVGFALKNEGNENSYLNNYEEGIGFSYICIEEIIFYKSID